MSLKYLLPGIFATITCAMASEPLDSNAPVSQEVPAAHAEADQTAKGEGHPGKGHHGKKRHGHFGKKHHGEGHPGKGHHGKKRHGHFGKKHHGEGRPGENPAGNPAEVKPEAAAPTPAGE